MGMTRALIGICLFIAAWQIAAAALKAPAYLLPQPIFLGPRLVEDRDFLIAALLPTLRDAFAGFILGNGLGVLLAVGALRMRPIRQALLAAALTIQGVPIVAIAPLVTLVVGYGFGGVVAITTLISFFPLFVNTMRGLQAVDGRLIELGRLFNAGRWDVMSKLSIPTAVPYMFAALRLTAPGAFGGAIVGEFLASNSGLGYVILGTAASHQYVLMWEATVVTTAVVMVAFGCVAVAERLLVPWTKES